MAARKLRINLLMLLRVIGWLLIIESAFMAVPLITSLLYHEADWKAFAISAAVTVATGVTLTFGLHPSRKDMGKREGFLLTASVWVVFSLFGMLPFWLGSPSLGFTDSYFEAMSGFTTTGVSVLPSVEILSKGMLIWRCLMQWIGGMGIILFTLAVLPMLNYSGGMQMFNAEVTGITHDKLRPRISQTAKGLWMIYIALTIILLILLWIGPMDFFESICHSFSVVSTGGFSTQDSNIAAWDSVYVKLLITLFMFLGGVNFGLMFKVVHGNMQCLLSNDVFRFYIRVIGVVTLCFIASMLFTGSYESITGLIIDPLFMVVSLITSTGYTVEGFEQWGALVGTLIFVLMFFGACAGSTSGGAKLDRMLYLFKFSRNELIRCLYPNTIVSVRMNGRIVSPDIVSKVVAFLCIFVMIIVAGGILLSAFGIEPREAFFAAFSCISNTGLGSSDSYGMMPDISKWILSLIMLIGRLELFTVLLLFTPGFWSK